MIPKTGKLFIDGKLCKNRYDKNEDYGVDGQVVVLFEIVKELFCGKWKITVSRYKELKHSKDFTKLAFDPPENKANA